MSDIHCSGLFFARRDVRPREAHARARGERTRSRHSARAFAFPPSAKKARRSTRAPRTRTMPTADPNERSLPGASLRSTGHSLDLIRDGRPRGGRRVGQYAPQNFPAKPSPLPNDAQWSEMCVTRPGRDRVSPRGRPSRSGSPERRTPSASPVSENQPHARDARVDFFRDSSSSTLQPASPLTPSRRPSLKHPQAHEIHPHASFDEPVGAGRHPPHDA